MRINSAAKTITFRQSGLDTYSQCPERARRQWFTDEPDRNTDATVTGTACHHGIEQNLLQLLQVGVQMSTADMIELAQLEYERIEREEGLDYVKGDKDDAMAFIATAMPAWRAYLEPYVCVDEHLKLEWQFDVPLMTWADWSIRLSGTVDTVDRYRVWDWKTAASDYKQWERQRWAIQPTVYSYAAVYEGLLDWPVDFRYGVIKKLKTKESAAPVEVQRWANQVDWLCQQINSLLILWDRVGEDGPWPLVDSHSLCSEKWCPYWKTCKGKFVPSDRFLWKP